MPNEGPASVIQVCVQVRAQSDAQEEGMHLRGVIGVERLCGMLSPLPQRWNGTFILTPHCTMDAACFCSEAMAARYDCTSSKSAVTVTTSTSCKN